MRRVGGKKPLYRKVNTRAHHVFHDKGGDYRDERNGKRVAYDRGSMHGKKRRGLDYTPLFRFLLSKVGEPWDEVLREAQSRLDRPDPIRWMVALREDERKAYFLGGDNSYFSGLYVDDDGLLQRVAPDLQPSDMTPVCSCCTHTLNGVRFG